MAASAAGSAWAEEALISSSENGLSVAEIIYTDKKGIKVRLAPSVRRRPAGPQPAETGRPEQQQQVW